MVIFIDLSVHIVILNVNILDADDAFIIMIGENVPIQCLCSSFTEISLF